MYWDISARDRAAFFSQLSGTHIPGITQKSLDMYLDSSNWGPRASLYKQCSNEGFIPGYTGHCPTLKFRFGQCYGTNTKQIMQEIRDNKITKAVQREPYRRAAFSNLPLDPPPETRMNGQRVAPEIVQHRSRKYILGYTGYIPGMSFRYGKSYVRAADDCMADFGSRLIEQRKRFENERRSRSAPQMPPIRNKDHVKKAMNDYVSKTRFKEVSDHHLSPNSPPIAGYTGHIPRMTNTETSLSQRFSSAARRSLEQTENERKSRSHNRKAEAKIAENVKEVQNYHKQRSQI